MREKKPCSTFYSTNIFSFGSGPPSAAVSTSGFSTLAIRGGGGFNLDTSRQREEFTQHLKYAQDSFMSARETGSNLTKQRQTFGVTLGKIELPTRLLKQKELFNEVGGWLSVHREKKLQMGINIPELLPKQKHKHAVSQGIQNVENSSNMLSPNSISQEQLLKQNQQKKLFYEHKNIYRVKDFKMLKDRKDRIAQSVDDPISSAQRRTLIQEFELKVSKYLKIMTIKKEGISKLTNRSFRSVAQSMHDLESIRSARSPNANNSTIINQTSSLYNLQNQTSSLIHPQNQASIYSLKPIQQGLSLSIPSEENFLQSPETPKNFLKKSEQLGKMSEHGQSSISALLGLSNHNIRPGSTHSEQRRKFWPIKKDWVNQKSASENKYLVEKDSTQFQFRTYYQLNEHQIQELNEKQLVKLSQVQRDRYKNDLDLFKKDGHRFMVQVPSSSQNFFYEEQKTPREQGENKMAGFSESKLNWHQRLQDFILEKCKNFLGSSGLEYDEKMKLMKQQYEEMLNNFEKKSFKIVLPPNVRVRGQDFNDYYIVDEYKKDNKSKKMDFDFDEIINENFQQLVEGNIDQKMQISEESEEEKNDESSKKKKMKHYFKNEEQDSIQRKKDKAKIVKPNVQSQKEIQQDKVEEIEQKIEEKKEEEEVNENEKDMTIPQRKKTLKEHKPHSQHQQVQGQAQEIKIKESEEDSILDKVPLKTKQIHFQKQLQINHPNIPSQNQLQNQVSSQPASQNKIQKKQDQLQKQQKAEETSIDNKHEIKEEDNKEMLVLSQMKVDLSAIEIKKEDKPKKEEKKVVIVDHKEKRPEKQENIENRRKNRLKRPEQNTDTQIQSISEHYEDKKIDITEKIANEMKAQEEKEAQMNMIHFDTLTIGTGFLDKIINCDDLYDLDIEAYHEEKKKANFNKNIYHKTELDSKIYEKLVQWEIEVEEENLDFIQSLNNYAGKMMLVEKGIHLPINIAQFTSIILDDHQDTDNDLQNYRKVHSAIDPQIKGISSDSKIHNFDSNTSIFQNNNSQSNSNSNYNRAQSNAIARNNTNNNLNSNFRNISNIYGSSKNNKTNSESKIAVDDNDNEDQVNSDFSSIISSNEEEDDDDESKSQKNESVNSLENLDNVQFPDHIPSVSDCSAFDQKEK